MTGYCPPDLLDEARELCDGGDRCHQPTVADCALAHVVRLDLVEEQRLASVAAYALGPRPLDLVGLHLLQPSNQSHIRLVQARTRIRLGDGLHCPTVPS